jgi:PIN domain nuclease of toxin-antitoxin system
VRVAVHTHALMWLLGRGDLLSEAARQALREAQDTDGLVVSSAVLIDLWHVTQTTAAFKSDDLEAVVSLLSDVDTNVTLMPIDLRIFRAWPGLNRSALPDPWDRLIVATALGEEISLVNARRSNQGVRLVDVVW